MGIKRENTGTEIVREKPVPNPLVNDQNPRLSEDLDAQGNDIRNVGNIECKTINGKNPERAIQDELIKLSVASDLSYAAKDHSHKEFSALDKKIDKVREDLTPTKSFAEAAHKHALDDISGSLPLSRLEKGQRIAQLLGKDLAEASHRHPITDRAIESMQEAVGAIHDKLPTLAAQSSLAALEKSLRDLLTALGREIEAVKASIPSEPKREAEVIGVRFVHIPKKAHGLSVQEIVGLDESGKPVQATVVRDGKEIGVGTSVSTDEKLHLSPPTATVRILFS